MTWIFSQRSRDNLAGVHPDLVKVVERALELSPVDFAVTEGLRTEDRQRELVAVGASRTMTSRHLTGHAVDLAPVVGGRIRWDWPLFYPLAKAMQQAAEELGVRVTWGGVWDRDLTVLGDPKNAMIAYQGRERARNREPFCDGPHFQLDWYAYPVPEVA